MVFPSKKRRHCFEGNMLSRVKAFLRIIFLKKRNEINRHRELTCLKITWQVHVIKKDHELFFKACDNKIKTAHRNVSATHLNRRGNSRSASLPKRVPHADQASKTALIIDLKNVMATLQ